MTTPYRRPLLPLVFFLSLILPWIAVSQPQRTDPYDSPAFEKIAPRPESSHAYYRPVFCLGEDYPSDRATEARMQRDMAILNQLGVHFLRCGFSWYEIEPERGKFKWEHWDRLVRIAREHHVTLLPYVSYTPAWAAVRPDDKTAQPPHDLKEYGRFMYQIAERYRDDIQVWELWNEPDMDEWKGTPAGFAAMLQHAASEVRRANPKAKVVLAGMARGPVGMFRELAGIPDFNRNFDIFALHAYAESWLTERLEDVFPAWPDAMADLLAQPTIGAPLWLNEFGYPDYRYRTNRATMWSDHQDVIYEYEHTPDYQATMLFKTQLLALASNKISLLTWYRVNDFADIQDVGGQDAVNQHLGLVDAQGRPKPVYHAYKYFKKLFDRPIRCIDDKIEIDAPRDVQEVEVHCFKHRNGRLIVAGWLGRPPLSKIISNSGLLRDDRRVHVRVKLPSLGSAGASLRAFNVQGQPVASQPGVSLHNNKLNLVLEGKNIQLLILEPSHKPATTPAPPLAGVGRDK